MKDLSDIIPDDFKKHLNDGKILVFIATPLGVQKVEPLTLGFSLTHIYESKILPDGPWISDKPIAAIGYGVTADHIIESVIQSVAKVGRNMDMIELRFIIDRDEKIKQN